MNIEFYTTKIKNNLHEIEEVDIYNNDLIYDLKNNVNNLLNILEKNTYDKINIKLNEILNKKNIDDINESEYTINYLINYNLEKNKQIIKKIYQNFNKQYYDIIIKNNNHKKWLDKVMLISENIPISVLICSAFTIGFPIIYANKQFEITTEYKYDDIIGKNCKFLQSNKTNLDHIKNISFSLKTGNRINIIINNQKKSGKYFNNLLCLKPIFDSLGKYCYVLGFQIELEKIELENQENEIKNVFDFIELFPSYII